MTDSRCFFLFCCTAIVVVIKFIMWVLWHLIASVAIEETTHKVTINIQQNLVTPATDTTTDAPTNHLYTGELYSIIELSNSNITVNHNQIRKRTPTVPRLAVENRKKLESSGLQ